MISLELTERQASLMADLFEQLRQTRDADLMFDDFDSAMVAFSQTNFDELMKIDELITL